MAATHGIRMVLPPSPPQDRQVVVRAQWGQHTAQAPDRWEHRAARMAVCHSSLGCPLQVCHLLAEAEGGTTTVMSLSPRQGHQVMVHV
jgi:hypothetical protein